MPVKFPLQTRRHSAAGLAAAALFTLGLVSAPIATAQVIYNSIPSPFPSNVFSEGPEAYAFRELGDGVVFTPGSARALNTITVVMSDWACTSGSWTIPAGNPGACVTTPNAQFSQQITMNIYRVSGTTPGSLLATKTATFQIPYRPSSDGVHCAPDGMNNDGKQWYNPADNTCYHGLALPITFDFTGTIVPDRVIITVAFNSTHYGPVPVGEGASCYTASGGCPYDSLNISTDGGPIVGSSVDPAGIFVNNYYSASACNGSGPTGVLFDDSGCWAGFHPQFKVTATPADALQIGYAANLNIGDSVVDLTSTGALNGFEPAGNICANVYVFSADQQLQACCSCPLTPNHLKALSVKTDLIGNTLTPTTESEVSIVVTATQDSTCNAAHPFVPVSGLRVWGTTLHQTPSSGYAPTETKFQPAFASASEITKLITYCGFIQANGSGYGVCAPCRQGALGATHQ